MTNDFTCAKCSQPIDPDDENTVQGTVSLDDSDYGSTVNKRLVVPGGDLWHRRCP
jgi:hypothetical protein